jgi:hypothetical protein
MRTPTRLLVGAYWYGAILDALMIVPLLVPQAAAALLGLQDFEPGSDYRYATAIGAALMAGWAALLVWGVRDPIGRRGVLLLTACPVVVGLIGSGVYAVVSGLVGLAFMVPVFASQLFGLALFVTAYVRAAPRRAGRPRGGARMDA